MSKPIKIKIIIGSTRPNRFSDKPARWIFELVKQQGDIDAELLDLRDLPLSFFNEPTSPSTVKGDYPNAATDAWAKKIAEGDAFIIVTPEYNHGYSAVLKNALDYVYKEWNNKAVGFVAYGTAGGTRAVEQLRQVAVELQMAPIRNAVHIPTPWNLLAEDRSLKPDALAPFEKSAVGLLTQLVWWAKALRAARENTV